MVYQINPPELQLNKANISDTEAPFLDLHLSVANGFVSSKIYDKRDDFDFDILSTTRAYLCVIAARHFLIDPHGIVKASMCGLFIYFDCPVSWL